MRTIARVMVVAVTPVAMTPVVADAEPMTLTATQMESVTAAAPPFGINVLVQTNITTQVANAIATAIATCGTCIGGAPSASSLAAAINANAAQQTQR